MGLIIETKVSVSGVSQRVQAFDYDQGEYVTIDERAATTTDRKLYFTLPGDPDVFMDGSCNVKLRILFDDVGVSGEDPWTASIDHVEWLSF